MAGETSRETTREVPRHPMGVVVQRTGLTSHVLRAWERRYGAVEPGRTEGGQRLYSDADVVRLRLLKRATEGGRAINTVATLPVEDLIALVGEDAREVEARRVGAGAGSEGEGEGGDAAGGGAEGSAGSGGGAAGASAAGPTVDPGVVESYVRACLLAADRMDARTLRAELMRAVVGLSAPVFITRIVAPLLHRVGELWETGSMRPAQEHVVSTAVRQVLDWLLGRYDAVVDAPLLVVGTLPGELHEFGAMLAAVTASDAGWRVLYLGPSLPAEEIAAAADRSGAAVVAVSVVRGPDVSDEPGQPAELELLRSILPEGVLLVVGGAQSSWATPEEVAVVEDLAVFREVLATAGP